MGEDEQATLLLSAWKHSKRPCPRLHAVCVLYEPLPLYRREAHVQPTIKICAPSCHQDRLLQRSDVESEVDAPPLPRTAIGANHRPFLHNGILSTPAPDALRLNLCEYCPLGHSISARRIGEHALKGMQVATLTAIVYLGPCPIDAAMMRIVYRSIIRHHFA